MMISRVTANDVRLWNIKKMFEFFTPQFGNSYNHDLS